MENVLYLDLQGPTNQMMMLLCRDNTVDNTVMYVVNNATCYANAIAEIAKNEGLTERQVDDMVYSQNGKKFKYKFLKAVGYKKLSTYSLAQLNAKLLQHFNLDDDVLSTENACSTKAVH